MLTESEYQWADDFLTVVSFVTFLGVPLASTVLSVLFVSWNKKRKLFLAQCTEKQASVATYFLFFCLSFLVTSLFACFFIWRDYQKRHPPDDPVDDLGDYLDFWFACIFLTVFSNLFFHLGAVLLRFLKRRFWPVRNLIKETNAERI